MRNTFLSMLIMASFLVVSSPAHAATSSTTVTSYGQYFYESGYDNTNSIYQLSGGNPLFLNKGAVSYVFFQYNFKNTYDGFVNLTLTANSSFAWQNVHFVVDGGVFTQQPNMTNVSATKSFQISFQNSTGFTLSIVSDSSGTFSSTSSITVGSSNFNLVPDVADDLHYLRGRWDYYVPGMSTNLSTIATNSTNIANDINILKSYLDSVEGYIDDIEPYLNQLINIEKIQSFPIWQQNILFWANSYSSLSFDSLMPYFNYDHTTNTSDWTASHRMSVPSGGTTSLIFYTNSNIQASNVSTYYPNNYPSVSIQRIGSTVVGGYPYYLVRLDITNTSNSSSTFVELEFNKSFTCYPIFYGSSSLIPEDVMYLFGTDFNNTYTRLLQQIADGIGNISQQQIIENNTNINNYNSYQQQINNVENNYYQQFNTIETNIENNNTFDFTGLSTDGVQVYNNLFSNVYGISLVKWPVLITLLGLVIVIILG